MFSKGFGVEVEFTGITRKTAIQEIAELFEVPYEHLGGTYDTYTVIDDNNRIWKIVSDASILAEKKIDGCIVSADKVYKCEFVSPILYYEADMEKLQSVIRAFRSAGGFTNGTCGIHIHVDGSGHSAQTIRNLIFLVASRNDLFYKAFRVNSRRMEYCKKLDRELVETLQKRKTRSMRTLENIWYACLGDDENRCAHYNRSRYYFLNLHCFFNGNGSIEFRGFNSELHAGKLRAYVVFALAINHQALTQKSAQYKYIQTENEKFAMRVYLVRIGLSGDEFKNCREHLYKHLDGNAAWRYGCKDACRSHRTPQEEKQGD